MTAAWGARLAGSSGTAVHGWQPAACIARVGHAVARARAPALWWDKIAGMSYFTGRVGACGLSRRDGTTAVNRVKAAFFSLTPPPGAAEDISGYLRWHLLDHMPEQYQLPGIVYATRWIADADCADARIAGDGRLQRVGSIMNYLVGDPVQRTHDDFMELGPRLAELGRYPEALASLEVRMLALLRWYAAPRVLVSAEVVPFRPHRGIVALVEEPGDGDVARWLTWLHEEHYPELLGAPGVAGAWMYGSTSTWQCTRAARELPSTSPSSILTRSRWRRPGRSLP